MREPIETPRAKHGSCSINVNHGKLRIRLPRFVGNGKQIHLYTGLEDTPQNHKKALSIATMIETDIERGRLDTTLQRYSTAIKEFNGKNQILDFAKHQNPTLSELWSKYSASRKNQVSPATFGKHFQGHVPRAIEKLPTQDINHATQIQDFLLETRTPNAAKRLLIEFNAACSWAVTRKLIDSNPFSGLTAEIKVPKYSWRNIDPFSSEERDRIIAAFDTERPEYADFVRFAFWTGARLGEIVGLQWGDVNSDCSEIYFSATFNQKHGRQQTKTKESRRFPCNERLQELLKQLQPSTPNPHDVVFKSPEGTEIKLDRFLRIWLGRQNNSGTFSPGIVSRLVACGEIRRYRKPYAMRHSFISNCLTAGIPVAQVSHWCGNSIQTIHQHYSGVISDFKVPDF